MNDKSRVYFLYRGATMLGTIQYTHDDFPWQYGSFDPTSDFEEIKELFDDELKLLQNHASDKWEIAWERIEAPGLRLMPTGGGKDIKIGIIHINDSKAWWRN